SSTVGVLVAVPRAFGSFWSQGVVPTFQGLGHVFGPAGLKSIGSQLVAKPGTSTVIGETSRPTSVIGIVEIANQTSAWEDRLGLFIT
ncbi:hypothetical protein, partial [Staphylococcus aureus]